MEGHSHLRDLAHAAAAVIGVPVDTVGDQFILTVDGIYECSFTVCDAEDAIEFSTALCLVGADREQLFEQALRLNLHAAATRGAAISLHPDASTLVLHIRQRASHLDAQRLSQSLIDLLDTARTLRHELHDAVAASAAMSHEFTLPMHLIRA
ncbi:CesT family type III secretion system chaperone [Peristeroidobacter soli]|uniref:CesT family type III secretion system chaperone n=1 Tax=Peristeroidobacter soli TaxID=2497877 RepID=UPI00101BD221|nr:CesT family type III secretion system chaperone [Peristeroidobacter soli]